MDWLVVTSPQNFARTQDHNFTVQGFKPRHRGRVASMRPGDRLLYYLTGEGSFAASARVRSECFEDRTRIWTSPGHPDEVYPWRVQLAPDLVVPVECRPQASEWAERLEFVGSWPRAHWRLAFQGMLRAIPRGDFDALRLEFVERLKRGGQEGRPG